MASNVISKSISKTKLHTLTPIQRTFVKKLLGEKYMHLYTQERAAADRDLEFDRGIDVTQEACCLKSADVPKKNRAEFQSSFGTALLIDDNAVTFSIDRKYDTDNTARDGVTICEFDGEARLTRSFLETTRATEAEVPNDKSAEEEMVAVPFALGKGAVGHSWVPKSVAGDMLG
jgi:hypothetical protein